MNDDLKGSSLADVLEKLEKGKIGHRAAMEWLDVKSYDNLVEIMHVNGRLMPGHQPMRVTPETRELVRRIFRPAAQPKYNGPFPAFTRMERCKIQEKRTLRGENKHLQGSLLFTVKRVRFLRLHPRRRHRAASPFPCYSSPDCVERVAEMKVSRRAVILQRLGRAVGRDRQHSVARAALSSQDSLLERRRRCLHLRLPARDHGHDPQATHQRRDCRADTRADGPIAPIAELSGGR